LHEADLKEVRFDLAFRGYRMAQVDRVLRRTAYDLGYKDEMIAVLEAEVAALREGRLNDAEVLRKAREEAASPDSMAGDSEPPTDEPLDRDDDSTVLATVAAEPTDDARAPVEVADRPAHA
jgi:DivIVA domain-containing protein